MNYYEIKDNTISVVEKERFLSKEDTICTMTSKEWCEDTSGIRELADFQKVEGVHFCKVEAHSDYMLGTMKIPSTIPDAESQTFYYYLLPEKIILICDSDLVNKTISNLTVKQLKRDYTLERFFYDFLCSFLAKDLLHTQLIERKISEIENQVLIHSCPDFNQKLLAIKKEISRFYRYYSQLTELGQELCDNELELFGKEDLKMFDRYKDRAARLSNEIQIIREYAMQVQDVYQSEIGIRQNDIMKVLTIVTTIFLPLTLIAGWYGMNFVYMPELRWFYSYPVIVVISLLIVVICLVIFKKKKYI